MSFHVPNKYRLRTGQGMYNSDDSYGNNGAFSWYYGNKADPSDPKNEAIRVIASDGGGWEHVSVSFEHRTPTWEEMCHVKDTFWDPEDCVVQFHPPQSEYVNFHPFCLHLWRPTGYEIVTPPMYMVGPQS
jgi:hypothetical protein